MVMSLGGQDERDCPILHLSKPSFKNAKELVQGELSDKHLGWGQIQASCLYTCASNIF